MTYKNDMESRIYQLERDLSVAEMNGWQFDIRILKDEIRDLENELRKLEG